MDSPMIEVTQIVRIPLQVMQSAPWWVDLIIIAAMIGAGVWVVSLIAAAIMSILLVLGTIALLAVVITVTWLVARRGGNRQAWTPIDIGIRITSDPAMLTGRRCAPCGPVYRPATHAVDGPVGAIYTCPDHKTDAARSLAARAITGGAQ